MEKKILIYYDSECGFCKKACTQLVAFLLLKNTRLLPIHSDSGAYTIFLEQYSWAVYDSSVDRYFSKSRAFWRLVHASPFFIFYYLSYVPFGITLGDKIYDYVAKNREKTCSV